MESNERRGVSVKKRSFALVFPILVLGLVYYVVFGGCGACLTDKDHNFASAVLNKLKEKGDTVLVSEVHPGTWESVCALGYGFNANLLGFAEDQEEARVLDDARHLISDADDDSAVVFRYNSRDLEIFRMTPDVASYMSENKTPCIDKEDAEFVLRQKLPGNVSVILRKTDG